MNFNKTELTMEEVITALNTMIEVLQMEIPEKAYYRITKNIKKFNGYLKAFHKTKDDLIRKYGTRNDLGQVHIFHFTEAFDKDGKLILDDNKQITKMENPKYTEFLKEVQVELGKVVVIEFIPISVNAFEKTPLTALQLNNLLFMLEV